ncbi:MAG: 1-acyl-sn-glycerol-3-phosphate acyltransferase [Prevotellaceae bacterium]|jgi:putative hemolysin|nr:1-acyl-sn-glycerol-3-phosphate acyltransferase [Prevotellaceae bacterium]
MVQRIDIDKILRGRNPGLYRLIPRFVLAYIKRIVHQEEVNEILTSYGEAYSGAAFAGKTLEHLGVGYRVEGAENFPPQGGRYIFASNHPLGGLDGLVLIDLINKHYGMVKFVVNDLLMNLKPLEDVFVPVNKHGRQSAEYVRRIDELYKSEVQVLYFPAGLCSRRNKGVISDPEWKKSFVSKAIKYERDVVPIYFDGRNSNFFYTLALIRKKLGVKANIEMFYLADELFKQRGAEFVIRIGKRISYSELMSIPASRRVNYVRNRTYEMK